MRSRKPEDGLVPGLGTPVQIQTHHTLSQGHRERAHKETSLVVLWLRRRTPSTGGLGSIPGHGTRSHIPQLKIPCATTMIKDPACSK